MPAYLFLASRMGLSFSSGPIDVIGKREGHIQNISLEQSILQSMKI